MRSRSVALGLLCAGMLAACAPKSAGHWEATVAEASKTGTPPAELAAAYQVAADVESTSEGCKITVSIEGFEPWIAGGQHCDDDGFEAAYSQKKNGGIEAVQVIGKRGDPSTMTVVFKDEPTTWSKTYEGQATTD